MDEKANLPTRGAPGVFPRPAMPAANVAKRDSQLARKSPRLIGKGEWEDATKKTPTFFLHIE